MQIRGLLWRKLQEKKAKRKLKKLEQLFSSKKTPSLEEDVKEPLIPIFKLKPKPAIRTSVASVDTKKFDRILHNLQELNKTTKTLVEQNEEIKELLTKKKKMEITIE